MKETQNPKVLLGGVVRKIYRQKWQKSSIFYEEKSTANWPCRLNKSGGRAKLNNVEKTVPRICSGNIQFDTLLGWSIPVMREIRIFKLIAFPALDFYWRAILAKKPNLKINNIFFFSNPSVKKTWLWCPHCLLPIGFRLQGMAVMAIY